jgi:anti-sigma factor RsiW
MQCDSAASMLGAYLDGELSADQTVAIQEHLGQCTGCSSEIAEMARLQHSVRGARGYFTPSAEFRRAMQKQIAPPRRRILIRWLMPAAIVLATILISAVIWVGHTRRAAALAELADLHVNALASTSLVDVVSSDRHTVKPWFQGRIPFTFNLPEFSGTAYTLVGGRMVYFHQQPGAQLIVSMHQHKISVLIFQRSAPLGGALARPMGLDRETSFGIETWESQQLRFVLVSDADPAGIESFATMLKQANE